MESYHEELYENCATEEAIDEIAHMKEQLHISEIVEKKRKKDAEDNLLTDRQNHCPLCFCLSVCPYFFISAEFSCILYLSVSDY